MLVLLFCTLNYFFTQTKPRILKIALSVIHTSAHLFNILLLIVGYAVFNDAFMGLDYNSIVLWIGFVLYMLILGSTSAGLIIGLYLYFSHYVGHTFENEVLACRSIENYKNFLRLHINKEGNLIVFPIGVDKVEKQWVYHKKPEKGKARFTPLGTPILERAHLIESPIVIEGTPTSQNKNQFI